METQDKHPAQHLHDTGFGPVYDLGDEPMPSEWRMWVLLAVLCAPWFYLLFWIAKHYG
jgi:hypothetical protein